MKKNIVISTIAAFTTGTLLGVAVASKKGTSIRDKMFKNIDKNIGRLGGDVKNFFSVKRNNIVNDINDKVTKLNKEAKKTNNSDEKI